MNWPKVLGEIATVEWLEAGFSVARFGDGELKCMEGRGYVSQQPIKKLAQELQEILTNPQSMCLPAIPTLDPKSPKYSFWPKTVPRFLKFLDLKRVYGSAFISRHDVCPWIDNLDYAIRLQNLWKGSITVAVASNIDKALQLRPFTSWVRCPLTDAYITIDALEKEIMKIKPDIVVMTAGATATCLANRLAGHGVQALDVGRAGRILRKYLYESGE